MYFLNHGEFEEITVRHHYSTKLTVNPSFLVYKTSDISSSVPLKPFLILSFIKKNQGAFSPSARSGTKNTLFL
jgi:hypothetical protein